MIATPTAHNLANTSAPTPAAASAIALTSRSISASGSQSKSAPKSPALGHSTKKPASRSKSVAKPGKLQAVKTRDKDAETWTIKTGQRGEKKPEFRVRLTDSGYRVMFRFHDRGKRPERYCCYLSVAEWKEAKSRSLADFVHLVAGKVEARYASGDPAAARYQEIAPRLAALI